MHSSRGWEFSHISFRMFKHSCASLRTIATRINRTQQWPQPESFRNSQAALGFCFVFVFFFFKSWQGRVCRVILFFNFCFFNRNFHHPSRLRGRHRLSSLNSRQPGFKEIQEHNAGLTSRGLACWAQAAESSRWVNFPAFGDRLGAEFVQVHKAILQGRTPAGWVCSPPRSSETGERAPSCLLLRSGPLPLPWADAIVSSAAPSARERSLSQLSHWDIFPHFQDYRHFHSDLCVLPPHTKKPSGTGSVGLEEVHICPVQAIGIQSFTRSNATKREKRNGALALHFSTFKRGTALFTGV